MAITRRTDYGIRIMLELARQGGSGPLPATRLSELTGVPYEFARSICTQLTSAGLLHSIRGVAGGFRLARPTSEISIADVLVAMEEPSLLNACATDSDFCGRTIGCAMHPVWKEADEAVRRFLGEKSLESILNEAKERC